MMKEPAISRSSGKRSSSSPTLWTESQNASGVAGCRKSNGVTPASTRPARRSERSARKREKAISSGDTPK
jgi:hypothetical protein